MSETILPKIVLKSIYYPEFSVLIDKYNINKHAYQHMIILNMWHRKAQFQFFNFHYNSQHLITAIISKHKDAMKRLKYNFIKLTTKQLNTKHH